MEGSVRPLRKSMPSFPVKHQVAMRDGRIERARERCIEREREREYILGPQSEDACQRPVLLTLGCCLCLGHVGVSNNAGSSKTRGPFRGLYSSEYRL